MQILSGEQTKTSPATPGQSASALHVGMQSRPLGVSAHVQPFVSGGHAAAQSASATHACGVGAPPGPGGEGEEGEGGEGEGGAGEGGGGAAGVEPSFDASLRDGAGDRDCAGVFAPASPTIDPVPEPLVLPELSVVSEHAAATTSDVLASARVMRRN